MKQEMRKIINKGLGFEAMVYAYAMYLFNVFLSLVVEIGV